MSEKERSPEDILADGLTTARDWIIANGNSPGEIATIIRSIDAAFSAAGYDWED